MTFGGRRRGAMCKSIRYVYNHEKVEIVLPYRGGTDTNCVEKVCA
jgi:hypothetical protein